MVEAWLTAGEAADRLRVKPATLYAYVSRGLVRRRTGTDGRRSEYHPGDVAALAVRGRRARQARRSDVVVATATTAITARGPAYRGRLAIEMAGRIGFEAAAAWLWDTATELPWTAPRDQVDAAAAATRHLPDTVGPARRLPLIVAAAALADPLRHDLDPSAVIRAGRSIIAVAADVLCETIGTGPPPGAGPHPGTGLPTDAGCRSANHGGDGGTSIATRLATAIGARPTADVVGVLDAALVLLADHELAASTLAARTAASARCDPYAVVLAGLSVVSGSRHGAASRPLEQVLRDVADGADPATALADRAPGRDRIPGFGHPLYPDGDPRGTRLLELLAGGPLRERSAPMDAVVYAAARRGLPAPTVDAALAAVGHAAGGVVGSGELLFAVARIAGWVAHALEQYRDPDLLRPRAVYTGPSLPGMPKS